MSPKTTPSAASVSAAWEALPGRSRSKRRAQATRAPHKRQIRRKLPRWNTHLPVELELERFARRALLGRRLPLFKEHVGRGQRNCDRQARGQERQAAWPSLAKGNAFALQRARPSRSLDGLCD